MENEQEIITRIKSGDRGAFKLLYNEYAEYALRVAASITRNKATAMDAVQEAFIRAYNGIHKFKSGTAFKPWFYRILINECNRILDKNKRVPATTSLIEIYPSEKAQEFEELQDAIAKLKEEYRIPLILKYLDGCTEKEIADTLQLNVNTVKAREKLKSILVSSIGEGIEYV
jgi:RNA polymerase sigma-70 factor (ECF subfamily)